MPENRSDRAYATQFDWAIYADATLAGLAPLIPLPFVDSLVEDYFHDRMPVAIAQRHNAPLPPEVVRAVNGTRWGRMGRRILLWPLRFLRDLLLRFARKILYFLSIKKAIDALNLYWQRAFLLDHMIRMGHLHDPARRDTAIAAMEQVLAEAKKSPLRRLARQLLTAPLRLARSVWRTWRGHPDQRLDETRSRMARTWDSFGDYFTALTQRYDAAYAAKVGIRMES